jgi:ABC-type amino acid transport substrate-binding protein
LEFEATQIQTMMLPNIFPIGSIDAERVKMMAESFKEMGLVAKDIPLEFGTFIYDDKEHPKELTQSEKEYLTRKGALKLCVDPTWMPLEAIQKGKYTGISSEFFNLLQKRSPLTLQLYPTSSWQESLKAAQERKCDIFTLASATPDRLKYMDFTESYITLPLVLATTMDKPFAYNFYDLKDKKIAVVKGYAIADILHKKYPNMPLVFVNNIQEGLKKVESGEAYGYVDNLMVLAYAIQHNFTNQIKISSRMNESVSLAIGTRNDEPMLHTIFEKLIYLISEKEKQDIKPLD